MIGEMVLSKQLYACIVLDNNLSIEKSLQRQVISVVSLYLIVEASAMQLFSDEQTDRKLGDAMHALQPILCSLFLPNEVITCI